MRLRIKHTQCWKFLALLTLLGLLLTIIIGNQLNAEKDLVNQGTLVLSEEEIKALIKDAEIANAKRVERVQKVCREYNLGLYKTDAKPSQIKHPPTPQYSVFYIDLLHKISYCPIYKSASSSLLYNLCLMGGFTETQLHDSKEQLSTIARKLYPELDFPQAEEALQTTLKLLVVRHPFERLLSAYRDKLENIQIRTEHGSAHFYKKYGAKIVQKYRQGGNKTKTQDILKTGTYFWDKSEPEPLGIEPTFKEFVRYIIDTDLVFYADDHWIPYYLFCTPCLLKYSIIAKVETFFRDQVYLIRAAKIQQLIKPTWRHKTTRESVNNVSKMYFAQLSQSDIAELYRKYELDFELFDYDATVYYTYAQKDPITPYE